MSRKSAGIWIEIEGGIVQAWCGKCGSTALLCYVHVEPLSPNECVSSFETFWRGTVEFLHIRHNLKVKSRALRVITTLLLYVSHLIMFSCILFSLCTRWKILEKVSCSLTFP